MHGYTFALNSFTFFLLHAAPAQDMGKVSHPPIFVQIPHSFSTISQKYLNNLVPWSLCPKTQITLGMDMTKIGIGVVGGGYMGKAHSVAMAAVGAVFDTKLRPVLQTIAASSAQSAERYRASYGY